MKIYIDQNCKDIKKSKQLMLNRHFSESNNVVVEYLPSGKPILVCADKDVGYVSISHTDGAIAMAFADKIVGIDIERKDRTISSKVCSDIKEWTMREAYSKYTGEGISKKILRMSLPQDIIKSFCYSDYIISVCSEEQIDGIETLIDNTFCKCYND